MQIKSSNLGLESSNEAYSLYRKTEQLQIKSQGNGGQTLSFTATQTEIKEQRYLAAWQDFADTNSGSSLRAKAEKLAAQLNQANQVTTATTSPQEQDDTLSKLPANAKAGLLLLILLLERFNKDPELMKKLGLDADSLQKAKAAPLTPNNTQSPQTSNRNNSPSMQYSAHESLYQTQSAQFSAQGQIKTADGKTININIDLLMHQESLQSKDTQLRLQAATKDPLVINLDGSAAELSEQKFSFDLNSNGQNALIPQLLGNRGFLALDKNNDGQINNGTELFGPQTGNGFAELAQYDEDGNGWIDENDSVYKNLKVWFNAGNDKQQLVDLKSLNIGALYTGSATTNFNLHDKKDPQTTQGIIQATGVFLKENAEAGTIQHVDLSV